MYHTRLNAYSVYLKSISVFYVSIKGLNFSKRNIGNIKFRVINFIEIFESVEVNFHIILL